MNRVTVTIEQDLPISGINKASAEATIHGESLSEVLPACLQAINGALFASGYQMPPIQMDDYGNWVTQEPKGHNETL